MAQKAAEGGDIATRNRIIAEQLYKRARGAHAYRRAQHLHGLGAAQTAAVELNRGRRLSFMRLMRLMRLFKLGGRLIGGFA